MSYEIKDAVIELQTAEYSHETVMAAAVELVKARAIERLAIAIEGLPASVLSIVKTMHDEEIAAAARPRR